MTFFTVIDQAARASHLSYLVIGGYAVIAHGYPRLTFDFDLAVERERRREWLECVAALGYGVHHDGGNFLQLASEQHAWPLDLMLLNESTFSKLIRASVTRNIGETSIRIPSVEHLLALKFHALKHTHARRFLKDFQDVTDLIIRNRIDLAAPEIREIFQRYGPPDLYEKVRRACADDANL
jgi:hypothetical protein